MLSSKCSMLNQHCQKFDAIYKRCIRLKKSGENEVDLMKRARGIYQDGNKNSSFNHEKAWAVLRKHAKWDAPDPASVELYEDENVHDEHVPAVNTDELFGPDPRPRPPGKQRSGKKPNPTHPRALGEVTRRPNSVTLCLTSFVSNGKPPKRRLRRRKIKTGRLRVWKSCDFSPLARRIYLPVEGLDQLAKKQIKDKLRAQMPRDSNNQSDDSDE
ncbi:hypothetical protein Tco_1357515 [Tanacetum coccineum]